MKTTLASILVAGMTASAAFVASAQAETVIIGHFGNPTPDQYAAAEKKFESATGWDIEWRKFAAGTDVIAAMASGDVVLSDLGSSPLAIAASQGVPIEMFMFAMIIGDAESLIVREDAGIETIEDLKGKRIAVPVGSTAHFSLMGALQHSGIGENELTIISMPPDQIAAAWEQDAIDGGFIWQPVQSKILQTGKRLISANQTADWGFPTFDAWVVNKEFAAANKDAMVAFTKAMNEANEAYLKDPSAWTPDSAAVKAIAERTGAAPDQVPEIIEGFTYLPLSEQVSEKWLGGGAAAALKATAEFLKEAGRIDQLADDYSDYVTDAFAKAALNE
ncbi:taurine ABC transporter substrate-binding protein [Amorphus coralli]|uniref:taurine ABC transporter substrate-binding protein n=1 Tax=Amorphus coralli TaxID=340680 RepID=UPI000372C1C2|nr:taurine ABC transporter substrate-binding protein [Amorphus coralli]